jgi:alanyl-tRNA synthetase
MDFTEQHSAQHLLSATILSLCGAPTLSMHLGAEKSNIDVDIPFMDQSLLERIEGLVNERIAMDLPLRLHLCPPENLDSFPLRKKPPQGEEILRIVDIGGIDYSPCCGTHVESTLRLRLIALTGAEKYKGMTRLGFVAGERACRYLSARSAMLDRAASSLGVGVMDISDRIASLSTRLHSRELDFDVLLALAARQSADLALSAEGAGSVRLELRATMMSAQVPMREEGEGWMTLAFEGDDAASCATFALECARALAAAGRPALVASIRDRTVCVELPAGFGAGRPDSGALPLKPLLSALCAESGGRGGGSGLSFRATFADRAGCERFMKAAGALELRRSPPSGKI